MSRFHLQFLHIFPFSKPNYIVNTFGKKVIFVWTSHSFYICVLIDKFEHLNYNEAKFTLIMEI